MSWSRGLGERSSHGVAAVTLCPTIKEGGMGWRDDALPGGVVPRPPQAGRSALLRRQGMDEPDGNHRRPAVIAPIPGESSV